MIQEQSLPPSGVIVDYDPRWPAMFEEERVLILGAVGHAIIAIEHVGSTSGAWTGG